MPIWEPHEPRTPRPIRVTETSCCAAYEWCSEAGQYFVLRQTGGEYEETGRGTFRQARAVWDELLAEHARSHLPATEPQ